jgi:galactokinase
VFGYEPAGIWSAPGRIDLPDLAVPVALRAVVAVGARTDRMLRIASVTDDELVEVDLAAIAGLDPAGWSAAPLGAVRALDADLAAVPGLDIVIDSVVPAGVGLGSRAAVARAVTAALAEVWRLEVDEPVDGELPAGHEIVVVELDGSEAELELAIETARVSGAVGAHASAAGASVIVVVPEGGVSRVLVAMDGAFAEHGWGQPTSYPVAVGTGAIRES